MRDRSFQQKVKNKSEREREKGGLKLKSAFGDNATQTAEQGSTYGLRSSHFMSVVFNCTRLLRKLYSPACKPKIQNTGAGIWFARYSILAVSSTPNQSVLSHFFFPLLPPHLFSPSLIQYNSLLSILSLKLLDPQSTGAGLPGYSPQALDAETGEASRHTCRITTPPFLTLT